MATRVLLLIGTRKGAFIAESDAGRSDWSLRGPLCEGWPVHAIGIDSDAGRIFAAAGDPWYGPAIWRSDDLGTTWTHSSAGLTYGDDGPAIPTAWSVVPAHGAVYAGVEPAGLFRSEDGGRTWEHVVGLRDHPSRPDWQPGNGGLILHTIVPHATDPRRLWVGISAVGTFETRDAGATWEPRNRGVRADFVPGPPPELGQCVHKLAPVAGEPEGLYQQNHCGVYRSGDGGATWMEITANLPSDFGFPVAAHPRDPATAWVIPHTPPERGRFMPDAAAAVWRTRDRGASWERLAAGLPQEHAYLGVLRDAMAVDRLDPVGVTFGTSNGELWTSADEGATWRQVAAHLPGIWAVEAVVVEG